MGPEAGCEAQGKLFEDEFATLTPPPAMLTDKAIDCRLRRMFKPRADGTYPLDEHWRLDAKGTELHFLRRLVTIRTGFSKFPCVIMVQQ